MRGAERPSNVQWSRPFLQPLNPVTPDDARRIFIDIVDDVHNFDEVDKILALADNIPLVVDLMARLVDYEGIHSVLARWETESTSLLSEGHDRRSNLELSISLSLSSPRIMLFPQSQELLSLLAVLPDGLSDTELLQSRLPLDNILACKAALLRTSLVYTDDQRRVKMLVPIREYLRREFPPGEHMVQALMKHFQKLLEVYRADLGTMSGAQLASRVKSNLANIHSILGIGLKENGSDLVDVIYSVCDLGDYARRIGQGRIPLMDLIPTFLPQPSNHRLEVHFITRLFGGWRYQSVPNAQELVSQALEYFPKFDDPYVKCEFPSLFTSARN
jgi:hypothetical protein